ncbi:3'-5' exonuclease [Marinactinospora endophytica]
MGIRPLTGEHMSWHLGPLAAFDTETTGTDPESDRLVSAALLRINGASGAMTPTTWLADPGVEIPQEATAIHGITTDHARAHGRPAAEVIGEILAALTEVAARGVPLVVYNAPYDLTLLEREARRHGHPSDVLTGGTLRVIDPLVIDKHLDRFRRGSRRLADVCAHHGVAFDGQAHGAPADALAAARLAWRLAADNEELATRALEDLHTAQADWRAEQAASFEAYLRRRDPDALVERNWPLIPAPDHAAPVGG